MKKILFSLLAVAAITISANAQVKSNPENQNHTHRDGVENSRHGRHRHHGMMLKNLNLSDAQKQQLKSDNAEFRNKMQALKKNDNMTVKDFKAQKEALMQERKTKFLSVLTPEQKTKMEQQRSEMKNKRGKMVAKRMEKMKSQLALSNDQIAKMKALHQNTKTQIESIRNNQSLTREQKKEQMMSLRKNNEEVMNKLLTPDQLKKREELKAQRREEFKNKKQSESKASI